MLKKKLNRDKFYGFTIPITSVYMSDDYLANDKTAPMMLNFFPDSPQEILKLPVEKEGAMLHCVRIEETENNSIEYYGESN